MNKTMIPYSSLTIQDDFIFGKVFSDPKLLIPLLKRIIPDLNVDGFTTVISQKTVDEFYDSHGIRIDIYGENGEFITALEMHINRRTMPVKRPRYYQSVLDMMQLSRGIFYDELKQQYVIIICPYDPFGAKIPVYTFTNICHENGMELDDGTTKIFLNCASEQWDKYPELKPFADYVMGKADTEDSFIREIDEAVNMARQNAQWRKEYMNLQEKLYLSKIEGIEQGIEQGIEHGKSEERVNGIYKAYNTLLRFTSVDNALAAIAEQYNITKEEVKQAISKHKES